MASAWGKSWGKSWGSAWGAIAQARRFAGGKRKFYVRDKDEIYVFDALDAAIAFEVAKAAQVVSKDKPAKVLQRKAIAASVEHFQLRENVTALFEAQSYDALYQLAALIDNLIEEEDMEIILMAV